MSDGDRQRLPIKLDANGAFAPVPVDVDICAAKRLAAERIADNARGVGLAGLYGAATLLSTLDAAFAARGNAGGRFRLPAEAALEPEAAASKGATSFSMSRPSREPGGQLAAARQPGASGKAPSPASRKDAAARPIRSPGSRPMASSRRCSSTATRRWRC